MPTGHKFLLNRRTPKKRINKSFISTWPYIPVLQYHQSLSLNFSAMAGYIAAHMDRLLYLMGAHKPPNTSTLAAECISSDEDNNRATALKSGIVCRLYAATPHAAPTHLAYVFWALDPSSCSAKSFVPATTYHWLCQFSATDRMCRMAMDGSSMQSRPFQRTSFLS